jgi:hypothetical protein
VTPIDAVGRIWVIATIRVGEKLVVKHAYNSIDIAPKILDVREKYVDRNR